MKKTAQQKFQNFQNIIRLIIHISHYNLHFIYKTLCYNAQKSNFII